jgi:hypothetical protein
LLKTKITSTDELKSIRLNLAEKEAKEILRTMSEADLFSLIEKAKLCFYDGPLKNGNSGLPLTIETAQKMIKYYPGFNLVGIGRTPAWLIEIAKLIDKETRSDKYKTIAFSGRWFQLQPHLIKPTTISAPNEKQTVAYRHYLENMKFTPEKIIEQDEQHHRKTVLIDFLQTGLSLYSFVSFILDWAEELDPKMKFKLGQSLIIHDLSRSERDMKDSLFGNLSLQINQFHSDLLKDKSEDIHWRYLAESSEKISGVFPVTEFGKDQWLNPPVETEENLKFQKMIRYKIIHYLHREGYLNVLDWQLPDQNPNASSPHFVERKKK